MTKLKGLEDREADQEIRIALQEDTIQILSSEVEELKGEDLSLPGLSSYQPRVQPSRESLRVGGGTTRGFFVFG